MNKNKLLKILTSSIIGSTLATISVLPFVLTTNNNNVATVNSAANNGGEMVNNVDAGDGTKFKTGDTGYTFYNDQGEQITQVIESGDVWFEVVSLNETTNTGEITVLGRNGQEANVLQGMLILPNTVKYNDGVNEIVYTVTSIGNEAFNECSRIDNSPVIPDSVTSIGSYAFNKCYFNGNIFIPKSVTNIGNFAFKNNSFNGVEDNVIYSSVSDESDALWALGFERTGFAPAVLKDGTVGIAGGVFQNDYWLSSVTLPDGLLYISEWNFNFTSTLKQIIFPKSLISIGANCFVGTGFSNYDIIIPDNVVDIGSDSFVYNEGTSPSSVSWWVDENKDYSVGSGCFSSLNSNFKVYSNNPAKLSSLSDVVTIKTEVTGGTNEIIGEREVKIADLSLSNGYANGIGYTFDAEYASSGGDVPSGAFEIRNENQLWYTGEVLSGNVNITAYGTPTGSEGYASSDQINITYASPVDPSPDEPTGFNTNIKGGKASDIGEYNLSNPYGAPSYSLVSATYVNGGGAVASGVFNVNSSTGVLSYNGNALTGNVIIQAKVSDNGVEYNFTSVTLNYTDVPSPDEPTDFNTNIKGGKASDIGEYNLSNPNASPSYSLVSATYVNGGGAVASGVFNVNSSTGVLSYNGNALTGDVTIQAKVSDNGVEYNFTSVTLNYTDAPSPNNPDPNDLNRNIKEGTISTIGTFELNNPDGSVTYSLSAKYIDSNIGGDPSNAFEVDNSTDVLSYDGTTLLGDVSVTITATCDGKPYLFTPVNLIYTGLTKPKDPEELLTSINEGKEEVIGIFELKYPLGNVLYSAGATYTDGSGSVPSDAFVIDTDGVLTYSGTTLTGDVNVTVTALDEGDGKTYDFTSLWIVYLPDSNDSNMTAVIAGTVGGVVGVLAIAGGTTAYFSKKKKKLA